MPALSRGTRLFVSALVGVLVPTLAVMTASGTADQPRWTQLVLSPGEWVAGFAGPMPVVGHGASGNPIREPTSTHLAFGMAGILFTVAVYGALTYLLLVIARRAAAKTTHSDRAAP